MPARAVRASRRRCAPDAHGPGLRRRGGRLCRAGPARATRIAHALRRRGVGPETRVALLFEPSPEAVAALLGVMKAGRRLRPAGRRLPARPARPPPARLRRARPASPAPAAAPPAARPPGAPRGGEPLAGEPETAPESRGLPRLPAEPRLRDLHLRLHRPAQGGAWSRTAALQHRADLCAASYRVHPTRGCSCSRPSTSTPRSRTCSPRSARAPRWWSLRGEVLVPGPGAGAASCDAARASRTPSSPRPSLGRAPLGGAAAPAGDACSGGEALRRGGGGALGAGAPLRQRLRAHGDERAGDRAGVRGRDADAADRAAGGERAPVRAGRRAGSRCRPGCRGSCTSAGRAWRAATSGGRS